MHNYQIAKNRKGNTLKQINKKIKDKNQIQI